jgi:uncharacterized SAM-binding protein YcdF (DUF218 family)
LFYHLAKLGWFLLEPSNLIGFVGGVGVVLCWGRFWRLGRRLMVTSLVLLLTLGLSPVANWLILPLEMRFPVPDLRSRKIDGIVVLGGAVQERQTVAHGLMALNDAGERMLAMADLARRYPEARVVFSGGSAIFSGATQSEGEVVREHLVSFGLKPDRVIIENNSKNTHDNAVMSRRLVEPKPGETWLLVTSAWHMPRSIGIFRQANWPVLAYPVDFRTAGWQDQTRGFWSTSDGLRRSDTAAREWVGLLVYRLTGKTGALFPGP